MRKNRNFTRMVCMVLVALLCLAAPVHAMGDAVSTGKAAFDILVRPDVRDAKNANKLAVNVLANQEGTAYLLIREAGKAAPTRSNVLRSSTKIALEAGVERTFYALTDAKIAAYDCYVAFASGNAQYGPFVVKNVKNAFFPAGSGTKASPYQIWTPRHLYNISAVNSSSKATYFKLMQNIDCKDSGYSGSAAKQGSTFNGTFDGNNKTIANLQGPLLHHVGTASVVQNVRLYNSVTSNRHGLVAAGTNKGTIKSVYIKGGRVSGDIVSDIGAICAYNLGTISSCEVQDCTVRIGASSAGGIAGRNNAGGVIALCFVSASITGNTAGGIVGHNNGGIVRACAAAPTLAGSSARGGIVGRVSGGSVIACASGYFPSDYLSFKQEISGSVAGKVNNYLTVSGSFGAVPINGDAAALIKYPPETRKNTAAEIKEIIAFVHRFDARHGTFREEAVVSTIAWTNLIWTWTYSAIVSAKWTKKLYVNESHEYIKAFPFTGFDAAGNGRVVTSTGDANTK